MIRTDQEHRPGGEMAGNPEGERSRYWYRKFVGTIDSDYTMSGLAQTQRPKIKSLISAIVSHTPNPGDVIKPIITNKKIFNTDGINLWPGLESLMHATEQLTGERHRYTPHEFVESLRDFSSACVAEYLEVDAKRKATQERSLELALSPDTKVRLKRSIDQAVEDPDLMERQTRKYGHPGSVYPSRYGNYFDGRHNWRIYHEMHISEQQVYLTDPSRTEEDWVRIHGIMRASQSCNLQTDYLLDRLPKIEPDMAFLSARGGITPYVYQADHEFVLAVPDIEAKAVLLSTKKGESLLTAGEDLVPGIPSVSSLTVIDPTILQLFDYTLLNNLPAEERIPFAHTIAPGSFSDNGVFVDTYLNYVTFLGLMGAFGPDAYVDEESYFKKYSVPTSL